MKKLIIIFAVITTSFCSATPSLYKVNFEKHTYICMAEFGRPVAGSYFSHDPECEQCKRNADPEYGKYKVSEWFSR